MSSTENAKMIENEVIFKRLNDQMKLQVERLFQGEARNLPLEIYCECSNEDCRHRISVDPAIYQEAHANVRQFITVPGHEVRSIEDVVERHNGYNFVMKRDRPPETTDMKLNKTDL